MAFMQVLFLLSFILQESRLCNIWDRDEFIACGDDVEGCNVTIEVGMCATCNASSCATTVGMCRFTWRPDLQMINSKYYTLRVLSCEDLTNKTCNPFKRKGELCNECTTGYGPSPYAPSLSCHKCYDQNRAWLWFLYILLEIIPLGIFYMILIVFNIHITSPPFTSFILFNQLFTHFLCNNTYIYLYLRLLVNNHFLNMVVTIINIWNLDLLRYIVPAFCVSSKLTDRDILLLQLVSGLSPFLFVLITYIGIELHARNFMPVVFLWKPFHGLFAKFRRSWDPKSSIIAGFATFLMLSFSKIQFIAYEMYFPIYFYLNNSKYMSALYDRGVVSEYAENMKYVRLLSSTSYFIPVALVSILLYLPSLILLFYPTKIFHRLFVRTGFYFYNTVCVLADAFQGHYKDGTDGTRDYRPAFCCSYILRVIYSVAMCQYSARLKQPKPFASVMIYSLLVVALFYAIVRPCKKSYMNVIESLVYTTASLVIFNLHEFDFRGNFETESRLHFFVLYFTLLLIMMPSLVFCIAFLWKVFYFIRTTLCNRMLHNCCNKSGSQVLLDEFPDRVENPNNYIPLP